MIQGQGFNEHDEATGQPWAGMMIEMPGMITKFYLCDKTNAESFRAGMNTLIDALIKTQPQLVVPNGRKAG